VAAAAAWTVAFGWGWQGEGWQGFRIPAAETRGRHVETPAEQEQREAREESALREALRGARKELLGNRSRTRGDDLRSRAPITGAQPDEVTGYTQREACMQMKLEHPERFGDVDCMSSAFDDDDPWFKVPMTPGR
jgi:hypothetical protein